MVVDVGKNTIPALALGTKGHYGPSKLNALPQMPQASKKMERVKYQQAKWEREEPTRKGSKTTSRTNSDEWSVGKHKLVTTTHPDELPCKNTVGGVSGETSYEIVPSVTTQALVALSPVDAVVTTPIQRTHSSHCIRMNRMQHVPNLNSLPLSNIHTHIPETYEYLRRAGVLYFGFLFRSARGLTIETVRGTAAIKHVFDIQEGRQSSYWGVCSPYGAIGSPLRGSVPLTGLFNCLVFVGHLIVRVPGCP